MNKRLIAMVAAGIAGCLAWMAGVVLLFGPAQAVLANPAYQSAKFLAVFAEIEPLPRAAQAPWVVPAGVLAIAIAYAAVYSVIRSALGRGIWSRGVRFGVVAWALMALWFEFYLPWNVMHEPARLVLLELALWLGVLVLVGVTISNVYERIARNGSQLSPPSPPGGES